MVVSFEDTGAGGKSNGQTLGCKMIGKFWFVSTAFYIVLRICYPRLRYDHSKTVMK